MNYEHREALLNMLEVHGIRAILRELTTMVVMQMSEGKTVLLDKDTVLTQRDMADMVNNLERKFV